MSRDLEVLFNTGQGWQIGEKLAVGVFIPYSRVSFCLLDREKARAKPQQECVSLNLAAFLKLEDDQRRTPAGRNGPLHANGFRCLWSCGSIMLCLVSSFLITNRDQHDAEQVKLKQGCWPVFFSVGEPESGSSTNKVDIRYPPKHEPQRW